MKVFRDAAAANHLTTTPTITSGPNPHAVELVTDPQGRPAWLTWTGGPCVLHSTGGPSRTVIVEPVAAPVDLTGPWDVHFTKDRGAPESKVFNDLHSWTDDPDDGVKYFSGTATYQLTFEVAAASLARGERLFLDLGRVRNVARITLNGKPLGICWTAPWRVDATAALQAGSNTVTIEVTNLWSNRMVGDAKLPPEKRICHSCLPPLSGPLLESGLLGPVRLVAARPVALDPP